MQEYKNCRNRLSRLEKGFPSFVLKEPIEIAVQTKQECPKLPAIGHFAQSSGSTMRKGHAAFR
jgi:hypothetical protein